MKAIKLIGSFLLLGGFALGQSQQETAFAAYLQQTAQYELATLEYERLLFYHPANDSVAFQLLSTYRLMGKWQRAIDFAQSREITLSNPHMRWAFQKEKSHNAVLQRDVSFLHIVSKQSSEMARTESEKYLARQLLFGSSLLTERPEIPAYENQLPLDGMLQQIYFDWENRSQKSPALAAGLSALVPGAGKVYAGAWKDGLVSALFVGANAFTTYRGFQNNGIRSPYVWIFGSLTAGFYVGNIYGAHKQAKKYNQSIKTKIKNNTYARLLELHR